MTATNVEIKFDDVRVGDTVQVEWDTSGVHYAATITVSEVDNGWLHNSDGNIILADDKSLTLLDRPKPELPTELGSVIVDVTTVNYRYPVAVLLHGDLWGGPLTDGDYYGTFRAERVESFTLARVVKAGDDND